MTINRPPLNPGCFPRATPAGIADQDICASLPGLRAAYYNLMSGGQTQQVRDGDRWQSFQMGNAKELKREITRLEIICAERGQARTVRVGPTRRLGGSFRGYAGFNTYRGY